MTRIELGTEVRVGTVRCTVVHAAERDRLVQVVAAPKYWRARKGPHVAVGGAVMERGRKFRVVAERTRALGDGRDVNEEALVDLRGAFWVDREGVTAW